MKMRLTSVILSKNEEKNIETVIQSVAFSDEIIIIDDNSEDRTCEIAENLGARILQRSLNDDYSSQRNFGLGQAHGKWVLFIDADEKVSASLKSEIIQAVNDPLRQETAYFLKRREVFLGERQKYGETGKSKFVRLAKKDAGEWVRRVHEYWDVQGKIGILKTPLEHHSHQKIREFISDINAYSSLHAKANLAEGKKPSLFKIIFWPKLKFFHGYFAKRGFLDETHGFIFTLLMSFHSFLAWSKLQMMQSRKQNKQHML